MRSALTLGAVAIATATTLVHCASQDEPLGAVEDAGRSEDAASEAEADAGADVLDAATEDEYDIPDGSVICEASPCVVALSGSALRIPWIVLRAPRRQDRAVLGERYSDEARIRVG